MNSKAKIAIICVVLICVAGVLWMATASQRSLNTLTYSQFLEKVRTGQIASVIVMGSNSGINGGAIIDHKPPLKRRLVAVKK